MARFPCSVNFAPFSIHLCILIALTTGKFLSLGVKYDIIKDHAFGHKPFICTELTYIGCHLIVRGEGYSTAELLHELPENLRDEVILNELGGILQNVPFFEGTETGFLKKLTKIVSSNLHCPGDFVYHAGDLGEEMYFVLKGFVEILSEDLSHVVNKLGSGGYFGEVRMVTMISYTNVAF